MVSIVLARDLVVKQRELSLLKSLVTDRPCIAYWRGFDRWVWERCFGRARGLSDSCVGLVRSGVGVVSFGFMRGGFG